MLCRLPNSVGSKRKISSLFCLCSLKEFLVGAGTGSLPGDGIAETCNPPVSLRRQQMDNDNTECEASARRRQQMKNLSSRALVSWPFSLHSGACTVGCWRHGYVVISLLRISLTLGPELSSTR